MPVNAQAQQDNDIQFQRKQFTFNGEWLPDIDPLKIGENNFSELTNLRYTKTDLIGVLGYSKVTSNPINATYYKGRSAAQVTSPFATKSYILSQQWNAAKNASKLYVNKTVPTGMGDFDATELLIDSAGASIANINILPLSQALYCNGVDMKLFAGDELSIAGFIQADSISGLTPINPIDYTEELRNTLISDAVTIATGKVYLVATTRPLKGITPYIVSANGSTSVVAGWVWTGTTWTTVGTITDDTSVGGKTFTQTGKISWNYGALTPKPAYIQGMLLYFYYFTISAGSATISQCTIDTPLQNVVDMWDGIYRGIAACQDCRSGVWEDYTGELAEVSSATYPIAAKWGGLTATDQIIVMFSERQTAIQFNFIAGKTNANAAVLTIYYWNGSSWVSVGTIYDGTSDGGKTFAKTGMIYWDAPSASVEEKTILFNVTGFAYKIVSNATFTDGSSHDGVSCDIIYGIPAPGVMTPRRFSFNYRNRLFLANYEINKEENRLDYGPAYTADCFNGDNSSALGQQMLVGDAGALVGAANIFNRFGQNIFDSELILKKSATHLLDGESPGNFRIYTISQHIGCPAPRTLATAEIAYEISKDSVRNIAMWLSARGPIIFDASILVPLQGVNSYFDPTQATCINYDYIANSHGWFDPVNYEYNICFPVGIGQQDCNTWIAYNLIYKKWFKRSTGLQPVPQATFQVTDANGNIYNYGLTDNGHMIHLEYGSKWNDTEIIECAVATGEHIPSGDIFDTTLVRRVKFIRETPANLDIDYTRSDLVVLGSGLETGDALVYGDVIEDPAETNVWFDGDNLRCAEVRENAAIPPGTYRITGGLLELYGEVYDGWALAIYSPGGDFVTAGFIPGLQLYTTDEDYLGPFIIDAVSAHFLVLNQALSRGPMKDDTGVSVTLSAYFISMIHYLNGDSVGTRLLPSVLETGQRYQRVIANCNKVGFSHKLRFLFNSGENSLSIKPLAWGYQYLVEREDITGPFLGIPSNIPDGVIDGGTPTSTYLDEIDGGVV